MSLSIFSSDNIKKYLALPSSEIRWHVGLVALFVLLILLSHWVANRFQDLEHRYGPHANLAAARDALSEELKVLFLGSSHVFTGIRPDMLSFKAMNVTGEAFDYVILEAILRRNLDSMSNLKLAVIELDPLPCLFDTTLYRKGDYRAFYAWGLNRRDVFELKGIRQRVISLLGDIFVPPFRFTPDRVHNSLGDWLDPERPKVIPGYQDQPVKPLRPEGERSDPNAVRTDRIAWLDERFNEANRQRNQTALIRMIEALRMKEVEVVFLRLPHDDSYLRGIPASWGAAVRKTKIGVERFLEVLIPTWNYEQNAMFDESRFMLDGAHLNSAGATIVSRILDQRIDAFFAQKESDEISSNY